MATDKASKLVKRFSALQSQRSTWEQHWQELGDYVAPRKSDIVNTRSPGEKRTVNLFDATAVHAAELLSASLHGMLTNASTPWFSLRFTNAELEGSDEAKTWLDSATKQMYNTFHRSNFQEQIHELYHDLIVFGTGVMLVEMDDEFDVRFSTRHISECYLSEDANGRVDSVFRKFKISTRAAVDKFGNTASLTKAFKNDPTDEIELLHVVTSRTDRDITKPTSDNKPFASIYINPETVEIIAESGFDEFPYMCPRYLKASNEQGYGRSPAMTALPDIKMLNKMSEVTIRSAQKQVDPPLMIPDDGFVLPIRTVPGGLNFFRSGTRDRLEPLNIGANNPLGLQMEEQRRQAIRAAFYVDQLQLGVGGPQMTATEVQARSNEKMQLLGPVLGRLQAELLQPLISRVFMILLRTQKLAPPPAMLQGSDVDIEYVSPLAKAQRQGDMQSTMQLFELMQPLAQVDPKIIDFLDIDGIAKHLIRVLGIPAEVTKGEEEIAGIRYQRQQDQAKQQEQVKQMQEAEMMNKTAPMMKALDSE
jgi:hypothetical protein